VVGIAVVAVVGAGILGVLRYRRRLTPTRPRLRAELAE
jgi:hypothetical protein